MGHALMENRHGLIVDGRVSEATGTAERDEAALIVDGRVSEATGTAERDEAAPMVEAVPGRHRITVGGDKHFDTHGFVARLRALGATPHVARHTTNRRSAIDGRTTRPPGYDLSRRAGKRIEAAFGWIEEVAPLRRARHRGGERVGGRFTLAAAAYDLIRLPELLGAAA